MKTYFIKKTSVFLLDNNHEFPSEKFAGIEQQREIPHDFENPLENLLEYSSKLNFVLVMDYEEGFSVKFEFPFYEFIFLPRGVECKL